ncbi:HemK family protein methyltransferase [Candidatus Saccharibacteria bacterium]|nr:HemK family protein methyltransferase [Candidatus Saccharibacteria bacterium]
MNANLQNKHTDFYGRDFLVTKDTLIPRPETEQIIDTVLSLAGKPFLPGVKAPKPKLPPGFSLLDVGTGSGCIAITIKKELPLAKVTASDISEKALKVALENADNLKADITFIHSDLLQNTPKSYDVIVANLPYVDKTWDWLDLKALSAEPSLALFAKDHGLALIKSLIDQIADNPPKYFILEADPCQHTAIASYAKQKHLRITATRGFILTIQR